MNKLTHLTTRMPLILAALLPSAALAQDLLPKAPPQSAPIFLIGATVHTVSGDDIDNGLVAFNEGTISLVTTKDALATMLLSQDVKQIDVTGLHIYPGFIAAETRMGLVETQSVRATLDYNEVNAFTPEVRSTVSVNPDSAHLPVARLNGVLIAASWPESGRLPGRAGVIKLDGWTWEDMTITSDAGLILNWPTPPQPRPWWAPEPDENEEDENPYADQLAELSSFFDNALAYHAALAKDPSAPRDLRFDAMAPYLPLNNAAPKRPIFIHADRFDQITDAVTWALQRNLKPTIAGGREAHLCADLLRNNDIPIILAGTHTFPRRADSPHDEAFAYPNALRKLGLTFAITPSDRDGNERNLPYEAGMAARYGLTQKQAIRSITLTPAEILGIADRYGSIEKGKSATLIITDGDPLEITTNVLDAYIDGKQLPLTTKQTELRDKYVEKYRQLNLIK